MKHPFSHKQHKSQSKTENGFRETISRILSIPIKSGRRIIYLSDPTRNLVRRNGHETSSLWVPYLVLHPMGFTVPLGLLLERWALTPPFHPYPAETGRFVFCCTGRQRILAHASPACTPAQKRDYAASCPVEFGLSSPGS